MGSSKEFNKEVVFKNMTSTGIKECWYEMKINNYN